MIKNFDFNVIADSLPFLWKGLQVSFYLTFLALIGAPGRRKPTASAAENIPPNLA